MDEEDIKTLSDAAAAATKAFYDSLEEKGLDAAYFAMKIDLFMLSAEDFETVLGTLTVDTREKYPKKGGDA